jgi:hypothetical protein
MLSADIPVEDPPGSSRSAGANLTNPMGSSHYGAFMIASSAFSGQ